MVNIIAIETALSACSVALSKQGEVMVLREQKPRQHIRLVLPMVDKLLEDNGLSLDDLDAIGFSQGPGSFTGLRIGMGIVQGLAFGADLPVVAVSTLQAMAQAAIDAGLLEAEQVVAPLIDARMDEVYWGIYKNTGGFAMALQEDKLSSPEGVRAECIDAVAGKVSVGLGDGWQFKDRISLRPHRINDAVVMDAEQILRFTLEDFTRGLAVDVGELEPLYLRDQISWKKRQRIREPDNDQVSQ